MVSAKPRGTNVSIRQGLMAGLCAVRILKVVYDVGDDVYVDMERKLAAALARD